jgi:N-acetylglutamate synthase-like GNAT family acetyltransferase
MADTLIRPYASEDREGVFALIVPIQQQEFGIGVSAEGQPDLAAIPSFYQSGLGGFWVAEQAGTIVGTIGLKDIGKKQGALRKMFVAIHARGREQGVAARLLQSLVLHAQDRNLVDIFLGTTEAFLAAHRFYEKSGFAEISSEKLPKSFPVMEVDRKFYQLRLV